MDSEGVLQVLQFKSHTSYQLSISSISFVQHLIAQRLRCNKSQAEQELSIRQHLQSQTQRENQTLNRMAGVENERRGLKAPNLAHPLFQTHSPSFTKEGGISCSSRIWVNTPVTQLICTKWAFPHRFWILTGINLPRDNQELTAVLVA